MIEISQAFGNAIIILGSTGAAFLIMSLIKNCPYVFDENFEVTEKSQMKISFWMNGIFLLIFLLFGFLILINDYDYLNLFKVFGIILVSLMTCLNFENKSSSYYICLLMYFILVFLNFNNMYETTPYNIVLVVLIILVLYRIKNINPYNKK
jgi:membrane protein